MVRIWRRGVGRLNLDFPHLFIDPTKIKGLYVDWKLLSSYQDTVEAEIVRGLLEENEIEVLLEEKGLNELMPHLYGVLGGTKIFVLERDFDRATKIVFQTENQNFDHQGIEEGEKISLNETHEEKAKKVFQISFIGFLTFPGLVHLFAVPKSIKLIKVWQKLSSRSRSYLVVGSIFNILGIILALIFILKYSGFRILNRFWLFINELLQI